MGIVAILVGPVYKTKDGDMKNRIGVIAALLAGMVITASAAIETPPAASGAQKADATSNPYAGLAAYDFGQDRQALAGINDAIRAANDRERLTIEQNLLSVLSRPATTCAAKQFICSCLIVVGTEASVPALSALLVDKDLSHMARTAIEHIGGKAADKALATALEKSDGDIKAGIIATVGSRGNADAVDTLANQLTTTNETVARAALSALASIGNPAAAKRLVNTEKQIPQTLKGAWADACLAAADRLMKSGDAKTAFPLYSQLYSDQTLPVVFRAGALRGIAESRDERSGGLILAALKSREPMIGLEAARSIGNSGNPGLVRQVFAAITGYDSAVQTAVLGSLEAMPGVVKASDIMPLCDSAAPAVAASAYQFIGKIGNAADVPVLVAKYTTDPVKHAGAITAITAMGTRDVDAAIIKELEKAPPAVQAELIKILALRNSTPSVPALIPFIGSQDAVVSTEAIKAITQLGDSSVMKDLAGLILNSDKFKRLTEVLVAIARRTDCLPKASAILVEIWGKADSPRKIAILAVLPNVGSKAALTLAQSALTDSNEAVYDAAVRSVSAWKDSAPIDEVLALASNARTATQKILALRGFIRMADAGTDTGLKAKRYTGAMNLANRDEEKKLVITGLGSIPTLDSFKIVSASLDNAALSSEAQIAFLKIATVIKDSNPADVAEGLRKIQAAPVNDWARDEAGKIMKVVKARTAPPANK